MTTKYLLRSVPGENAELPKVMIRADGTVQRALDCMAEKAIA